MSVTELADPSIRIMPLTRQQYHSLADGEAPLDRVELINGLIIEKPVMKDPHASAIVILNRVLTRGLAEQYAVRTQLPIAASDFSEPEPDIAITDFAPYTGDHPPSAHLIIEVAFSSHHLDLVVKPRIYAAAGVPRYWVLDLPAQQMFVHADPAGDQYRAITAHGPDEVLDAVGVSLRIGDLLAG